MTSLPNYSYIEKPCGHPCTSLNQRTMVADAIEGSTSIPNQQEHQPDLMIPRTNNNEVHIFIHDSRQNVRFDNDNTTSKPATLNVTKTAMESKISSEKMRILSAKQKDVGVMTSEVFLSSTSLKKSSSFLIKKQNNKKAEVENVPSPRKKSRPSRSSSGGRSSSKVRPSSVGRPSREGRPSTQVIMYPDKSCFQRNSSPSSSKSSTNCQTWYLNPCYDRSWSNSCYGYGFRRHC